MSAFGAYPLLLDAVREAREFRAGTAASRREARMRSLERRLPGIERKLRRLAWTCGGLLALMLALDLRVFFPRIFVDGLSH
jgi:hypothetical protein